MATPTRKTPKSKSTKGRTARTSSAAKKPAAAAATKPATATKAAATKTTKTTVATPKAAPVTTIPGKPVAVPAAPKPTIVSEAKPAEAAALIKKNELIDRVCTESGMKKKDVKPVVEAMLSVMGKALADGEEMQVPPMGKLMINRVKDLAKAKVIIMKLRQPKAMGTGPKEPLARPAE